MDEIIRTETIDEYNKMMGVETLNPFVSVIDFSKCEKRYFQRNSFGFYAIFLKDVMCGDMIYGKSTYDYQEGTLVFLAPNQVIGIKDNGQKFQPKGYALVFHPELIRGTQLAKNMKDYTFFSYKVNEALHISEQERKIVLDCLDKIKIELNHSIDKHSKTLICNNIDLLLSYCLRFYDRQFITRENVNKDLLSRFEEELDEYFNNNNAEKEGLPTVAYFASKMNLSNNYFGDLIKKETGKTAQEHIQNKIIDLAKEEILDNNKSISEIAYSLGFNYPGHFTRLFKNKVGVSPNEYRA
jgi:AraC-like DNA-binding protein